MQNLSTMQTSEMTIAKTRTALHSSHEKKIDMQKGDVLVQRINLTTGMPHHALQKVFDGGGPQTPVQL